MKDFGVAAAQGFAFGVGFVIIVALVNAVFKDFTLCM